MTGDQAAVTDHRELASRMVAVLAEMTTHLDAALPVDVQIATWRGVIHLVLMSPATKQDAENLADRLNLAQHKSYPYAARRQIQHTWFDHVAGIPAEVTWIDHLPGDD